MASADTRAKTGRYQAGSAYTVPGDLPREGRLGKADVVHGLVDDPNPALKGKQQKAAINRRTDALETEHSHRRISEEAYRAGRAYQRILERSNGKPTGGGQWMEGDRVDGAKAIDQAIDRNLTSARIAIDTIFEVQRIVGIRAGNVLRMTLLDRMTIAEVAEFSSGTAGRYEVNHVGKQFRDALQDIADHWKNTRPRD